jgi:hypothetical protein
MQVGVEDPPVDDDVNYEPMGQPELTEEEVVARTMAISKAKERSWWIGLEAAIQASQHAALPPLLLALECLPPPPMANVCPPPWVFIDLVN